MHFRSRDPLRGGSLVFALVATLPTFAAVTVSLAPPPRAMMAGQRHLFRAQVTGAGAQGLCDWAVFEDGLPAGEMAGVVTLDGQDGSLAFVAPMGDQARTFTLRATSQADAEAMAEVEIRVLPRIQPEPVPAWAYPQAALPRQLEALCFDFADWPRLEQLVSVAGGPRFPSVEDARPSGLFGWDAPATVADGKERRQGPLTVNGRAPDRPVLGVGCPASFAWPQPAAGARQLFFAHAPCRGEQDEFVWRQVDGKGPSLEWTCTEPVQEFRLETIEADGRQGYRSAFPQIRGLLPLAGNPAESGDQDGKGPAARFRAPHGIALLTGHDPECKAGDRTELNRRRCAVADPQAHALRMVYQDTSTRTFCGKPGEPGFQDGPAQTARFRGPAFVAAEFRRDGVSCARRTSWGPPASTSQGPGCIPSSRSTRTRRSAPSSGSSSMKTSA
jgi:hypothetical protein